MPAPLTAPPRPPSSRDRQRPPRTMTEQAKRGTRRRAVPRWTGPALRTAVAGLAAGLVGGIGYLGWTHGTFAAAWDAVEQTVVETTGDAGFVLGDVLVEGRHETEKDTLIAAIGVHRGAPIFGIDINEARFQIEQLPWVEHATVQRRLPDLIYVRLSEREPLAIWQNERRFTVIDRAGRPLADAVDLAKRGNKRIETLPQIVGPEAPAHVGELLEALAEVPEVRKRMAAASWIGNRRWDVKLDNGIVVKLPENDMALALQRLAMVQARERVFERDIVAVDLRQPDRMVLQTAESADQPPSDDKKKPGKKI
jgi:cell division protein FtsQ